MSKIKSTVYNESKQVLYRYAHVKRDGHFTTAGKLHDGRLICLTSNPTNITGKLQSLKQFEERFAMLPKGTTLLCELWQPGKRAEAIKTLINDHSAKLQLDCFAVLLHNGNSMVDTFSLDRCEEISNACGFPFVKFQPIKSLAHQQELIASVIEQRTKDADIEGLVFKNSNLLGWAKWKPRKTIDLIIGGYGNGEGKYQGLIGSIHCFTSEGYHVADCSGMTDEQRRYISSQSEALLGQPLEVEYQNVGAGGRLRHPSFVRIRDDKHACDCHCEQDAALKAFWIDSQPLFK